MESGRVVSSEWAGLKWSQGVWRVVSGRVLNVYGSRISE